MSKPIMHIPVDSKCAKAIKGDWFKRPLPTLGRTWSPPLEGQ